MQGRADIEDGEDVARMVEVFYQRVYGDALLRPVFADVAQLNLDDHLPKMTLFWRNVLFGESGYRGDPMMAHRLLDEKVRLTDAHYERWLSLFDATVNDLFFGPRAERAKEAAVRISGAIAFNLERLRGKKDRGMQLL